MQIGPDGNDWYEIDADGSWIFDSSEKGMVKVIAAKCIIKKIIHCSTPGS